MLERTISLSNTSQISSMKFSILDAFFRLQKFADAKEHLNDVFVETASKLPEKDFKPMFTKICDWVNENQKGECISYIHVVDFRVLTYCVCRIVCEICRSC